MLCKIKGREQGAWFQIQCVKAVIIGKEAEGIDATFERELLKSWSHYPGWEDAKEALSSLV